VVARLRRASGVRRIGHAGTLDPLASGLLLVGVGQATRLIEYLADAGKAYDAEVTFGVETETYDAEGRVVAEHDASTLTAAAIEGVLPRFRGTIGQRAPAYSAVSVGGRRLYQLARQGRPVEPPERTVEITRLELRDWQPPVVRLTVECSKGTYIRSLAHDLGQALGVGAHLSALRRTRVGHFTLDQAVPLDDLEARLREGRWQEVAVAPADAVTALPLVQLTASDAARLGHGLAVPALHHEQPAPGTLARAYDPAGRFLAVVRFVAHAGAPVWRPEKVFAVGSTTAGPVQQ
jgi:tRNA pseudouridine55 synthase